MWTQALLIYLFLHYIPGPRASLLLSEHAKCLSVGVFVVAVPSANSSLCPLHGVLVIKLLWLGSESVLPHSALRYWGWGICTPQLCRISFASWAPLRICHKGTLEGDWGQRRADGTSSCFLIFPVSNAISSSAETAHNFLSLLALSDQALQGPSSHFFPRFW